MIPPTQDPPLPEELRAHRRLLMSRGAVVAFEGESDGRWRVLVFEMTAITVLDPETLERLARFPTDGAMLADAGKVIMDTGAIAMVVKDPGHPGRLRFICPEAAEEWHVDFDDGEVTLPKVAFKPTRSGGGTEGAQGERIFLCITGPHRQAVRCTRLWPRPYGFDPPTNLRPSLFSRLLELTASGAVVVVVQCIRVFDPTGRRVVVDIPLPGRTVVGLTRGAAPPRVLTGVLRPDGTIADLVLLVEPAPVVVEDSHIGGRRQPRPPPLPNNVRAWLVEILIEKQMTCKDREPCPQ
jgi:hypothetical protein